MNRKKTKILFVQTFRKSLIENAPQQTFRKIASQFIQTDIDILRKHFDVRVAQYQGKEKITEILD